MSGYINKIPARPDSNCSICWEPLDENVVKPICSNGEESHIFHRKCIKDALKLSPFCPICFTNIGQAYIIQRKSLEGRAILLDLALFCDAIALVSLALTVYSIMMGTIGSNQEALFSVTCIATRAVSGLLKMTSRVMGLWLMNLIDRICALPPSDFGNVVFFGLIAGSAMTTLFARAVYIAYTTVV